MKNYLIALLSAAVIYNLNAAEDKSIAKVITESQYETIITVYQNPFTTAIRTKPAVTELKSWLIPPVLKAKSEEYTVSIPTNPYRNSIVSVGVQRFQGIQFTKDSTLLIDKNGNASIQSGKGGGSAIGG